MKPGRRASEVEFILEINGEIIPIEVKAGINTRSKSLKAYIDKYQLKYAVKFTGNKYGYDEIKSVHNFPLYMVSKFPDLISFHICIFQ